MPDEQPAPTRFIGLDVHKHYLVTAAVDADLNELWPPHRVPLHDLSRWVARVLRPGDAVVLEMTTNTWELYDTLAPHVHSVTVVHPPHVALITRSQVVTDKSAARILARLLAKGLLDGIWVPPDPVRDQRALMAQRSKMVHLATQAKNRLHSLLHRHAIALPEGNPFAPEQRQWWLNLPLTPLEKGRVQCDLDTLGFARGQTDHLEGVISAVSASDERIPLLIQLPGVGLVSAMTILSAIGDIRRFPDAQHLVGYAGLGTRVHLSGLTMRTGRITKAGRRELRTAMVEAAQTAANTHPHWQAELARLERRTGRNRAIVAIARKLLVTVWHALTKETVDRHADAGAVARSLVRYAHDLRAANRPGHERTGTFVRRQLDRLGIGQELQSVCQGSSRRLRLPPSALAPAGEGQAG